MTGAADPTVVVRAAGGVVWRDGERGVEVVLVHRPRYEDWSLPKGKLERGEHPLAAAVREVAEETGVRGVPQVRLPTVTYLTADPVVHKAVDYWSMRAVADHGREPDHEVSQVRWVPLSEASRVLTYAHDRGVVAAFARLPRVERQLVLVRHANAGSRRAWSGPDALRPLDSVGLAQVAALTPLLRLFEPDRVVSASPIRCRETVAPLAEASGLPVLVDPAFDEPPGENGDRPGKERLTRAGVAVAEAVRRLTATANSAVVCSQGKVIPGALANLAPANATVMASYETAKGAGWLLAFSGTDVVAADRLVPDAVRPA